MVLVHHFPETTLIREVWHTFKHQCGGAVSQRSVDDIGMACDPAHIRGTPVDVAIMIVEDILMGHRSVDKIAAGGVQHTLWLAGGAGSVEDEQRIFRVHWFRFAGRFDACDFLMIPEIAARSPADLAAGTAHSQDLVDHHILLGSDVDSGIGVFFQWNRPAAAHAFIRRDDESGFTVNDTTGQCFRRKASKDDGMHRTNTGAGEHCVSCFRDHRQIDGDAITLLDAMLLQHIGKAADIFMQLAIGDLLVDIRIVTFPDDRNLIATAFQMTVDTVVGDVSYAILIPLDRNIAIEIGVLDFGEGFEPINPSAVLGPESIRVGHALIVPFEILLVIYERVLLCPRQNRVKLFRHVILLAVRRSSRRNR